MCVAGFSEADLNAAGLSLDDLGVADASSADPKAACFSNADPKTAKPARPIWKLQTIAGRFLSCGL